MSMMSIPEILDSEEFVFLTYDDIENNTGHEPAFSHVHYSADDDYVHYTKSEYANAGGSDVKSPSDCVWMVPNSAKLRIL